MKVLKKLDEFQKMSKGNLINEMMKETVKGGVEGQLTWRVAPGCDGRLEAYDHTGMA